MNAKPFAAVMSLMALIAIVSCGSKHEEEHEYSDGADKTHSAEPEHDADHDGQPEQVVIPADIATEAGIHTALAGPGVIRDMHEMQGLLTPIEGRHTRVRARFPGPVRAVSVGVGDTVKAGDTLAVIESNISLSPYNVTAPFSGTILNVDTGIGDLAGDAPLFELADLSTLWVDVHLFGADAQHIVPGLPVRITRLSDGVQATTKLDRILPGTATASQSTVARATIENSDGRWRPGTAVRAQVAVAEREAALVVPIAALQKLGDATVVFTRSGETYTARQVRIGERDIANAEVLGGLKAGETIVVAQSYLIKSDLEKQSASHEH